MPVDSLNGEKGSGTLYATEAPDGRWLTFNRKNHTKQLTLHKPG